MLFSAEVVNRGDKEFNGVIRLDAMSNGLSSTGAPYVQPVFLSPGQRRWVQFYPF